ncbi:MAG: PilZ domain-containing protein [Candidatus Acidiferrales bacterium]
MPMIREIHPAPPKREDFQQRKQRAVLRCSFVASAEVTELDSGSSAKLAVRTSELGLGGCYIDTLNPFPEGTPVRLRILRDGGAFATTAKVVYTHQGFGMGLAFIDITPSQRAVLENWLAELVTNLKPAS